MQGVFIDHPHSIYSTYLRTIKGKEFTSREVDIIACIVCGRSVAIPSFLSIAPKTISVHITSILQKISGNSREDIINFVEKSTQRGWVIKYYESLVVYFRFEKFLLENLSSFKGNHSRNRVANTRAQLKNNIVFIKELEKHSAPPAGFSSQTS